MIYFVAFCSLSVVAAVSDLGILVLVLSAIVLTVALGLITCVLSHYRPVAGEGAADGGHGGRSARRRANTDHRTRKYTSTPQYNPAPPPRQYQYRYSNAKRSKYLPEEVDLDLESSFTLTEQQGYKQGCRAPCSKQSI
jgi:hypothetical protein